MSRFFAGGLSESESSSEEELLSSEEELTSSEEESSEEEEEDEDEDEDEEEEDEEDEESSEEEEGAGRARGASRFLRGEESEESEEEETKRVVKSAKDKRLEDIDNAIKALENAIKINDWVTVSNEFERLNRAIGKAQRKPVSYIKILVELEDAQVDATKNEKTSEKKMTAPNARALNVMKQKLRKNNRQYENEISAYRKDPAKFVEGQESAAAAAAEASTPSLSAKPKTFLKKNAAAAAAAAAQETEEGFTTVGKGGRVEAVGPANIFKELLAILDARGKKGTDRLEIVRSLERLAPLAQTDFQRVYILHLLLATRFDLTTSTMSYTPIDQWKQIVTDLENLLDILYKHPEFVLEESAEPFDENTPESGDADGQGKVHIRGNFVPFVERLDDELTRSLQHIDPHTTEYVDRLRDESVLYRLILYSQIYYEKAGNKVNVDRLIARRIEHIYFKPEQVIQILEKTTWESIPKELDSKITPRAKVDSETSVDLIHSLCSHLYHQSNHVIRTRAMLCHIYHLALMDHYHHARNMFLMSHLQSSISGADISTQILYNRALVQVGLCAFRNGLISEAQQSLQELCGSGRVKELLAQGFQPQRYSQLTPEQERQERQRQLPFHMHINLELLECVYLTTSMLLEVPAMVAAESSPDGKKRIISKPFRRMLEYHERQIFVGPPENTRDHIMQAAKSLSIGDWSRARDLIYGIKIWNLMPKMDKIREMLGEKIQEEGLRTYLFSYSSFYNTLSISTLSDLFGLSERKVIVVVTKMVSYDDIAAALDQKNGCIVFRPGTEYTKLQSLALTLSDKAAQLVESNERLSSQGNPDQRMGGDGGGARRQGGNRRNDYQRGNRPVRA